MPIQRRTRMKAHAPFGVVVRTIGIGSIVSGVASLTGAFASSQAAVSVIGSSAVAMVIGAILFFGADGFVRTAYRHHLE